MRDNSSLSQWTGWTSITTARQATFMISVLRWPFVTRHAARFGTPSACWPGMRALMPLRLRRSLRTQLVASTRSQPRNGNTDPSEKAEMYFDPDPSHRYGDYQQEPEEPYVGSPAYPP